MSSVIIENGVITIHLYIYLRPSNKKTIELPIHYNYLVQSAIYNSIDANLADFLHQKGYTTEKRSFKMFSFSLLQGMYQLDKLKKAISFEGEIRLIVSSPLDELCQSLVNILLTRGSISLGKNDLEIVQVAARKFVVENNEITIRTLSPVVLYSTMFRPDGRKYTVYFQPGDPDYERLLSENLQKKFRAFYGTEPPVGAIQVKPLGLQRLRIINYKDTIIKGYTGKLLLSGPSSLLQLAVDGGLGSKNSQGFGCVEVDDKCYRAR
jgi:CRISPR-associated endoribonuclease Cas6